MRYLYSLTAALLLSSTPLLHAAEPTTVKQVDIKRYMGQWHEIARLPMKFQDQCVSNITANYTLNPNNSVTVLNSCHTADGSISKAEGLAKATDASASKLSVTFLPKGLRWLPIGKASYWILRLDNNYQTALVGTPDRRYLWLLSRTPTLNPETYQSYLDTARSQGYDLSKLIRNPTPNHTNTQ